MDIEEEIRDSWLKILSHDSIDDVSNFFGLGGDSAMAMALLLQIEEKIGTFLEPSILYENPSFGRFVEAVRQALDDQVSEDF